MREYRLYNRNERITDSDFQVVEIESQLRNLPRITLCHLCSVSGLKTCFGEDSVYLGLYLLILGEGIYSLPYALSIVLPHDRYIFCDSGIIHQNGIFVFQAFRSTLNRFTHRQ